MRLKTKVTIFFLALALLSGSLILGLTWYAVRSIVTKNLVEAGLSETRELAETAANGFETQSEALLLTTLQTSQRAVGADYAAVLDLEGRVLAHTNVVEKGAIYQDSLSRQIARADHSGTRVVKRGKEPFLEVWSPIWMKPSEESNEQYLLGGQTAPAEMRRLGTVRLSLPMRETLRTQNLIIRQMTFIVGCIGLFAFFFTLGLMRKLLVPIRLLAQGTSRIAQGQYGIEVPITSHDELGDLAKSFNRMSLVLSESTVSKDFMSKIQDNLLDPLIVTGPDTVIKTINLAVAQLLGYKAEELTGQPIDILAPGKKNLLRANQEYDLRHATLRNLELNLSAKNGAAIPVLFSSTVIKDDQNQVLSIIVTAKDMTERKKLEMQLLQTGKLSAVGQLAGGVAHEINNPLGVILGFAQGMLRRVKPGDVFEMPLKAVEREALRCKNLVQDLLTFSRTSKAEREPMDLNQAIEGALSLVMAQARLGQIQVQKNLAPNLPRILGNPNQVQQIIINLANNALDAMGKQGTLTLRTEFVDQAPRSWICLYVTDTGAGIPPEVLPRIYDPFFTTKPVGQGTGLGLGLVHEIVQKHSAMIEVQSRPGHTEFCIKFPVRMPQRTAPSIPS